MKIVIIGCGYVGKAIAKRWTKQGHQVTATTTSPEKVPELETIAERVIIANGDNIEVLGQVIEGQEVVLLSIAARSRTPAGYKQTYLETAQNLVTALKQNQSVKQLIYTASYAVLGDKQGIWIDETAAVAPANENGEILLETERVLLGAARKQLKICLLRIAGIYGPGRELIKIFRSWSGTTRPGTGKDYTNWVHLEDIVGSLELIQSQELEGIYHLANDTPLTTQEFYDRLFQAHGLPSVTWDNNTEWKRAYNLRLSNQKLKAAGLKLVYPETVFA
jgi:nucleoside-diphosphate-sugar epimerase